jgi:mannosyltransferase OCH1-like enzyme
MVRIKCLVSANMSYWIYFAIFILGIAGFLCIIIRNTEINTPCRKHKCIPGLKQRIPKRIFRIWFSDSGKDPNPFKDAWEYTARENPEYEQILLRNKEVDQYMEDRWEGPVLDAYRRLCPGQMAARADLVRYCLMYDQGGVYLDCKSAIGNMCEIVRPMDGMLLTTWMWAPNNIELGRISGEFLQFWLACAPGNPLMLEILMNVVENIMSKPRGAASGGRYGVLSTTGPLTFSKTILKNMDDPRFLDYRILCTFANGILIYDYAGNYKAHGRRYDDHEAPLTC